MVQAGTAAGQAIGRGSDHPSGRKNQGIPVGAERANYPDVFEVGSIAEDGEPPDDPSHLRDWLMVRDISRRLVEGA
jgi:hypothetical protein